MLAFDAGYVPGFEDYFFACCVLSEVMTPKRLTDIEGVHANSFIKSLMALVRHRHMYSSSESDLSYILLCLAPIRRQSFLIAKTSDVSLHL